MCRRIVRMCSDRLPLHLGQGQILNHRFNKVIMNMVEGLYLHEYVNPANRHGLRQLKSYNLEIRAFWSSVVQDEDKDNDRARLSCEDENECSLR